MDRRPLLGAHIPALAAVWVLRRLNAADVEDSLRHLRSTGQGAAAEQVAYGIGQLREAARQWEQRNRDDGVSVDGSAEAAVAEIAPRSGMRHGDSSAAVVSTGAAAGMLDVSERRVRQLLAGGLLAGQRIGRQWLVERDSVEAYKADRGLTG